MRQITRLLGLTLLGISLFGQNKLTKEEKKEGFQLLFDGKTLKGWEGEPDLWSVSNGEIVGNTDKRKIPHNTFLITKKEYSDFELRLDMLIRNYNSGVQFRSERLPEFVVKGLQADAAEKNYWGGIYDEKGTRGIMVHGWKGKAETVVKNGEYNSMIIRAKGPHIEITINGLKTAELDDPTKLSGIIALQLHAGPGMEARFKNIRLLDLSKK
ncbi:3-keto-disaccharide hydrolase [Bryobacter aggregatus]|uniref:3-keto-disaccharide hydrolase n=1 Tax=Bryobacter aggregatus TaxID=360054 RepID=UPI00138E4351|nr:DUF1080 domain-containing protein [Bryobacter aggregatus]